MTDAHITRFTVADPTHGRVPCVEVANGDASGLPLCIFLYGGGGSSETLTALVPLLEGVWQRGAMPACRVVTPDVGPFSFYLDDPARGMAWETFVAERLVDHLAPMAATVLIGVSMGGYGALKMAFSRPQRFRAVAAVAPMIEPAFVAADVPLRNRYHYPPDVPAALLGAERDPALYASDHPANRARRHAAAIRMHDLAIFIDAGSRDALHAHDGAEFLHRVLWDLDLSHEYHLLRDADHVGPTLVPRLDAAFAWVGERLRVRSACFSEDERALRAMLEPARRAAARGDPSFERGYGILPEL